MPDAHAVRGAAIVADVVGSRGHEDRAALQLRLQRVVSSAEQDVRWLQPLHQILGDELQGAVADLTTALRLGLELRLALLPDVDIRVGIGVGSWQVFPVTTATPAQDGPGWWSARHAVEEAKTLAARAATRHVRLRVVSADDTATDGTPVADTNAFLELQDFLVAGMSARQLRLLTGVLDGQPQRELAQAEGISQSAVSQALHASGAHALLHALRTRRSSD